MGVDTTTDTTWAVLDAGSGIFAVVPEPSSIHLLAGGMLTFVVGFWWRRRARMRAAKAVRLAVPARSKAVKMAAAA